MDSIKTRKGLLAVLGTAVAAAALAFGMAATPASAYADSADTSSYIIGRAHAAAEPMPEILGICNPNMRTSDFKADVTDMQLAVWGTSYSTVPDPYYVNTVSVLSGADTKASPTIMQVDGGSPMQGMSAYTNNPASSTSDQVWEQLPSVIIGTGGTTIVDEDYYLGDTYAKAVLAGDYAKANGITSYSPIAVTYVPTNLNTMMDTMYRVASAADRADAADSSRSLRYGSATDIAKLYEEYITGTKNYVLKSLDANDDGDLDDAGDGELKTVAVVSAYNSSSSTYTLIAAGTQQGTAATDRFLEGVQYVSVNLGDTKTTATKSDLEGVDLIMVEASSGAVVSQLNTDGLLSKTYYADGSAGVTFDTLHNSADNATNVGRILPCLYPEIFTDTKGIQQNDLVAYYYNKFYHISTGNLGTIMDTYMDNVRNWNATDSANYLLWSASDADGYDAEKVQDMMQEGMDYAQEHYSTNPATLLPTNYYLGEDAAYTDISGATVTLTDDDAKINVGDNLPTLSSVSVDGKTVNSNYYTVAYYDPNGKAVEAGSKTELAGAYKVTITVDRTKEGTDEDPNNYTGTASKTITAAGTDISGATVALTSASATYDGAGHAPSVTVTLNGQTLDASNYTVGYANGNNFSTEFKNAGTYTVSVKGKGAYEGTATATAKYTINAATLQGTISAISSMPYTGEEITPSVTLTNSGTTYKEGTDYYLIGSNNTNVGTATVTAYGMGNYKGSVSANFEITAVDISDGSIAAIADQSYTGNAINPDLTVTTASGTELQRGTDYNAHCYNNTNTGTATVYVAGAGNYTGNLQASFKIVKTVSDATVTLDPTSFVYDGTEHEPGITVIANDGTTLTPLGSYIWAFANNTDAGTGTVTITGKNTYSGTVSKTFTIAKASKTINLSAASKTLTGKAGAALSFSIGASASNGDALSYSSDAGKYVTVDKNGKVTVAKNWTGTAKITITSAATANYNAAASKTYTVNVKPAKMNKVTAKNSASKKAKISWTKMTGADKYQIRYRVKGGKWKTVNLASSKAAYTLSKLTKGKTYQFQIRAYDNQSKAWSSYSATTSLKIKK